MKKIDFMIVGAQKSGTTTIYDFLAKHPNVFVPEVKEIRYFCYDEFHQKGERYFDTYFSLAGESRLWGIAYAHQLYFANTAKRVHDYNKNLKLIAVLRNPIERAYSAYWFARRNQLEPCDTFEEALGLEQRRKDGSFTEKAELTYLSHGHYYEQLSAYLGFFDKSQLHVIVTDDLKGKPARVYGDLLDFLGLPSATLESSVDFHSNTSGWPRFAVLHKFLVAGDAWYKKCFRAVICDNLRYRVRRNVLRPLIRHNIRPFKYPAISKETSARLQQYYAQHNAKLEELLGRDLSIWSCTSCGGG